MRPQLVRRLVLAGTGPQGGERMHRWAPDIYALAMADEQGAEHLLALFFDRSPRQRRQGMGVRRAHLHPDRGPRRPVTLAARDAQIDAITHLGDPDPTRLHRLAGITQPTLAANGDNDVMVPTPNSGCLPSASRMPGSRSTPAPTTASSSSTRRSSPPRSTRSSADQPPQRKNPDDQHATQRRRDEGERSGHHGHEARGRRHPRVGRRSRQALLRGPGLAARRRLRRRRRLPRRPVHASGLGRARSTSATASRRPRRARRRDCIWSCPTSRRRAPSSSIAAST